MIQSSVPATRFVGALEIQIGVNGESVGSIVLSLGIRTKNPITAMLTTERAKRNELFFRKFLWFEDFMDTSYHHYISKVSENAWCSSSV